MKLIFLYGPPAVGKLTVAKILEEKTGFKLFHNHMIINPIVELFGWENPSRRVLVREFRLRILEEASKSDISLIITVGNAGPQIFDYFDDVIRVIELHGGNVCMIRLTANKEALLERVSHLSRKEHGKNFGKEKMEQMFIKYPHIFEAYKKKKHLTIDNTTLSPEQTVEKIIQYYKL